MPVIFLDQVAAHVQSWTMLFLWMRRGWSGACLLPCNYSTGKLALRWYLVVLVVSQYRPALFGAVPRSR